MQQKTLLKFQQQYLNNMLELALKLLAEKYKLPVVSIGMTKELDCPTEPQRIYLDDDEWRTGVRTLMENADRINYISK